MKELIRGFLDGFKYEFVDKSLYWVGRDWGAILLFFVIFFIIAAILVKRGT